MVLENDDRKVWTSLVSMGRRHCYAEGTGDHVRRAVYLAASKLLGGLHPTQQTSYEDTDSMQGVASMLCRLGLRPRASSAFASQAIANFMAVLHHINYKLDAHICSYVTKPVLAFGVTHVWYEIKQQVLGKYILPKFWELLTQGVIETGDIGVVVARSFLLLAMDATIAHGLPVDAYSLANGTHHFIGQFCSVKRFLRVFDGSYKRHVEAMADNDQKSEGNGSVESKLLNVEVEPNDEKKTPAAPKLVTMDNATPEQRANFESWMDGWDQWRRCFSHFFELTAMQATATLWFLLGRRAAGAFPRDQDEADFMIPIFCKSTAEVSFVIVKSTNEDRNDWEFVQSALERLTPGCVFQEDGEENGKHELIEVLSRNMIRIYVSLREHTSRRPAQSYLIDNGGNEDAYTLCLQGIDREGSNYSSDYWPFMSAEISKWFAIIADPLSSDVSKEIEKDLESRSKVAEKVTPRHELLERVSCTLNLAAYDEDDSSI